MNSEDENRKSNPAFILHRLLRNDGRSVWIFSEKLNFIQELLPASVLLKNFLDVALNPYQYICFLGKLD